MEEIIGRDDWDDDDWNEEEQELFDSFWGIVQNELGITLY